MIRIYVDSDETAKQLIEESKYIHNFGRGVLDIEKCNTLAHLCYTANEMIIVDRGMY